MSRRDDTSRRSTVIAPTAAVRTAPHLGARVPGWVLRAAFAAVAGTLAVLQLHGGVWLVAALMLVAAGVIRPRTLAPWLFLAFVGLSMLWIVPSGHDGRFFVMLAAAHATHLLACWMLEVTPSAAVQLRALLRPLARFLAIQAAVQAIAVIVLLVVPGLLPGPVAGPVTGAGFALAGVIGAVALAVLALLLLTPILRESRD